MNKPIKEWVHYILVFGVLLLTWIPAMNLMGGNVYYTSVIELMMFIGADLVAHKLILNEDIKLW
jgi:hypothetical protein